MAGNIDTSVRALHCLQMQFSVPNVVISSNNTDAAEKAFTKVFAFKPTLKASTDVHTQFADISRHASITSCQRDNVTHVGQAHGSRHLT